MNRKLAGMSPLEVLLNDSQLVKVTILCPEVKWFFFNSLWQNGLSTKCLARMKMCRTLSKICSANLKKKNYWHLPNVHTKWNKCETLQKFKFQISSANNQWIFQLYCLCQSHNMDFGEKNVKTFWATILIKFCTLFILLWILPAKIWGLFLYFIWLAISLARNCRTEIFANFKGCN